MGSGDGWIPSGHISLLERLALPNGSFNDSMIVCVAEVLLCLLYIFHVQHWPQILHQGTGSTVSRSHSCWTAAAHFNSDAQIFLDLACGGPLQAGSYSFCSYNSWNLFAFSGPKKKKLYSS